MALELYKNNPASKIWWVDNLNNEGEYLFSFDKKQFYNLFQHLISLAFQIIKYKQEQ